MSGNLWNPSRLSFWVVTGSVGIGIVAGILAGTHPYYLCLALVAVAIATYFFTNFEQAVLGLLVLRSSLDLFSAQQIPAAFAIGLDALTLIYVALMLLAGQKVQIDKFWWFFAGWVGVQGLWIVLMLLGGLGLDASYWLVSVREWVRLFSWLMVYLLVMQLRGRVHPIKIINTLFLSLILPLSAALLQIVLPPSMLPPFLTSRGFTITAVEEASRINGTLGHPNTFATFLVFFIGLTLWQLERSHKRLPWLLLLGILVFFVTSTKTLIALVMIGVLGFAFVLPRLTLFKFLGIVLLLAAVIGLFASTEFGRERLASIADTPLLNPDMDVSQAILLRQFTPNSFLWRIEQWTYLLQAWKSSPVFGYGLDTSPYLTHLNNAPHNDYIRALVEGGIVGLLTFVSFLGAHLLRLARLFLSPFTGKLQKDLCLVLISILLAIIVGMLTDNIWSHTTLFFYWLSLTAVVGWNWEQPQPS